MARVKFGSLISDIQGSIGGHTFQHNAYGYSVRTKPSQSKQASAFQQPCRINIALIVAAWQNLSSASKIMWNNFSAYSTQYAQYNAGSLLSGYALFLKYNAIRLTCGLSLLTTISYNPITQILLIPAITRSGGWLAYRIGAGLLPTNYAALVKFSAPANDAAGFKTSALRVVNYDSASSPNYTITVAYVAKLGLYPEVGNTILASFQIFSTVNPIVFKPSFYSLIITGT